MIKGQPLSEEHKAKMKAGRDAAAAARAASVASTPAINPPVNPDIIHPPSPPLPPRRNPAASAAAAAPALSPREAKTLLAAISAADISKFSFDDCSEAMTALMTLYNSLGNERRTKREQLDAASHLAPCETCGKNIDISKPGGFQILTVRDEHFQPKNVYFCGQNCLLGNSMKGKQRTTPGPHNQAGAR